MLDDLSSEDAVLWLARASCDETLPASARSYALELSKRLARGVRIALLGPSSVGKSDLCDALLGFPTVEKNRVTRVFGNAPEQNDQSLPPDAQYCGPIDPGLLGQAQIIDYVVSGSGEDAARQVQSYLESADIVLWCTQRFEADEARLWRHASDHLKDHSFLVLTKADKFAKVGQLQESILSLQGVVSEEFHSFFPVTTSQLRKLQSRGETVPGIVHAASGVRALSQALSALVRSGRRADLDNAILFLERQGRAMEFGASDHQAPDVVVTQSEVEKPRFPEADAFSATRSRLMEQALDLAELGFDEAEGDMSQFLDLCSQIAEELVADMRCIAGDMPEITPWTDAFEDASDKILLMSTENDTRSAADAVTILLQLRRDLDQLALSET